MKSGQARDLGRSLAHMAPLMGSALYHATAIAPHALTVRNTWTMDADHVAELCTAWGIVRRLTAAGTLGQARIILRGDSAGNGIHLLEVHHMNNAVNAIEKDAVSGRAFQIAPQTWSIQTEDLSTTGTVKYDARITFTEGRRIV